MYSISIETGISPDGDTKMKTIEEVREMTNEQILVEMRKIAGNQISNNYNESKEAAMYFAVMCQRTGKDLKPKIKTMGYGIYEEAETEGWF